MDDLAITKQLHHSVLKEHALQHQPTPHGARPPADRGSVHFATSTARADAHRRRDTCAADPSAPPTGLHRGTGWEQAHQAREHDAVGVLLQSCPDHHGAATVASRDDDSAASHDDDAALRERAALARPAGLPCAAAAAPMTPRECVRGRRKRGSVLRRGLGCCDPTRKRHATPSDTAVAAEDTRLRTARIHELTEALALGNSHLAPAAAAAQATAQPTRAPAAPPASRRDSARPVTSTPRLRAALRVVRRHRRRPKRRARRGRWRRRRRP